MDQIEEKLETVLTKRDEKITRELEDIKKNISTLVESIDTIKDSQKDILLEILGNHKYRRAGLLKRVEALEAEAEGNRRIKAVFSFAGMQAKLIWAVFGAAISSFLVFLFNLWNNSK